MLPARTTPPHVQPWCLAPRTLATWALPPGSIPSLQCCHAGSVLSRSGYCPGEMTVEFVRTPMLRCRQMLLGPFILRRAPG